MTNVTPYPAPPYLDPSDLFRVRVDGKPVDVVEFKGAHLARLALAGPARFEIECRCNDVRWVRIGPQRLGIRHEPRRGTSGRDAVLVFEHAPRADGPTPSLVIRVGRDRHAVLNRYTNLDDPPQTHLVLLIDPPTPYPDRGRVLDVVRDGHADPTGASDCAPAFERLVEELHHAGGGTLHVPDGVYSVPGIVLADRVQLRLAPGAFLRAPGRPDAYQGRYAPADDRFRSLPPFVRIDNAADVAIVGHGVLDARNEVLGLGGNWARSPYRRHGIRSENARRLLLDGPLLMDTMQWATRFNRSRDITVRNYKVVNNLARRTNDGINIDGSHSVRVQRCFVYVGDDGLNVKASFDDHPAFDVRFEDCSVVSGEIALQMGAENTADIHDVAYERIEVIRSGMVIGILGIGSKQTKVGGIRDIRYHDIHVEELFMASTHPNNLDRDNRRAKRVVSMWTSLPGAPIERVRIRDLRVIDSRVHHPPELRGCDHATLVRDIRFENVNVNGKPWVTPADAGLAMNEQVRDVSVTSESRDDAD